MNRTIVCIVILASGLVASASVTLSVAVDPQTYEVTVYGQVNETCDGLALFCVDLSLTGPQGVVLGDRLNLDAPTGMASFDRNGGVSNPSSVSGDTGYGGTPDGDTLRHIGGGQNTLANLDPPVAPRSE